VRGVFELDWPWPLAREALGGNHQVSTGSLKVRIEVPGDAGERADPKLEVKPTALAESPHVDDDFRWGLHYEDDLFGVLAVGFTALIRLKDIHTLTHELRLALDKVNLQIGWFSAEPVGLARRQYHHRVPLWTSGADEPFVLPGIRLEYSGFRGAGASRPQLIEALGAVSRGEELSVAKTLWCQARADQAMRDYRRAVIMATSAAEVAVETAIYRHLEPLIGADAVQQILRSSSGIVAKRRMLSELGSSGGPSGNKLGGMAEVRNKAAHAGYFPEPSEVRLAVAMSRQLIVELEPESHSAASRRRGYQNGYQRPSGASGGTRIPPFQRRHGEI
jgi:hypothetical protein